MSTKAGLAVVLIILVGFCIIAAGVGGFFGWRYYNKQKAQVALDTNVNAPVPPQPIETATPSEPSSSPQTPAAVSEKPAVPSAPAQPSTPPPAPKPSPAETTPGTPSAPTSPPVSEPEPVETVQPEVSSTETAVVPETTAVEEPAPKKVKVPHGQIGLIFESRVDQGKLSILVDGISIVEQNYTASSSAPFRWTNQKRADAGKHFVKVTVTTPDSKIYDQGWYIMVKAKAVTVWKIQFDRFPKKIVIKHIQ